MGTRSNIVLARPDGMYVSIYCHWDGYPSHNGKLLLEHYDTQEKVEELIALGDLSTLGSSPVEGTTAYHRDKGENLRRTESVDIRDHYDQEYVYLFSNGHWTFSRYGKQWDLLTEEVCGI
jgi:hypothetical protein